MDCLNASLDAGQRASQLHADSECIPIAPRYKSCTICCTYLNCRILLTAEQNVQNSVCCFVQILCLVIAFGLHVTAVRSRDKASVTLSDGRRNHAWTHYLLISDTHFSVAAGSLSRCHSCARLCTRTEKRRGSSCAASCDTSSGNHSRHSLIPTGLCLVGLIWWCVHDASYRYLMPARRFCVTTVSTLARSNSTDRQTRSDSK